MISFKVYIPTAEKIGLKTALMGLTDPEYRVDKHPKVPELLMLTLEPKDNMPLKIIDKIIRLACIRLGDLEKLKDRIFYFERYSSPEELKKAITEKYPLKQYLDDILEITQDPRDPHLFSIKASQYMLQPLQQFMYQEIKEFYKIADDVVSPTVPAVLTPAASVSVKAEPLEAKPKKTVRFSPTEKTSDDAKKTPIKKIENGSQKEYAEFEPQGNAFDPTRRPTKSILKK